MKKVVSIVMVLTMLLVCCPAAIYAAESEPEVEVSSFIQTLCNQLQEVVDKLTEVITILRGLGTEEMEAVEEVIVEVGMIFEEGMYRVGIDIPAGEYKIYMYEDEYTCFYTRMSNSSGEYSSIIVASYTATFAYITVLEGEYFQIEYGYAEYIGE